MWFGDLNLNDVWLHRMSLFARLQEDWAPKQTHVVQSNTTHTLIFTLNSRLQIYQLRLYEFFWGELSVSAGLKETVHPRIKIQSLSPHESPQEERQTLKQAFVVVKPCHHIVTWKRLFPVSLRWKRNGLSNRRYIFWSVTTLQNDSFHRHNSSHSVQLKVESLEELVRSFLFKLARR